MPEKISVIGLGKLGACSAACFAAKGFSVLGVDINRDVVELINQGKAPVYEPLLQETISASAGRFQATQDFNRAITETDITLIIVPTPSRSDGGFSDKYVRDALGHLAGALKRARKPYHLFAITSTVSPGACEEVFIPLLEKESGLKLNNDFGVCYNPEFIALGSVISDFLNPDLVLIGESNEKAGSLLAGVYQGLCGFGPHIARMSLVSAEVTKISLNSYVTMKISFANTLANICEAIPGADIDAITQALGADKRIAPYYLKGGLSFGGPCFPRDNRAFTAFAQKYGQAALLAKATDEVNQLHVGHVAAKIRAYLQPGVKSVAIIGLAYKPNTSVIEESAGIKIVDELRQSDDLEIFVYDPLALKNAKAYFSDSVLYAASVQECFANSSVCVIATPAQEFRGIDNSYIVNNPTTIIDCWRILDRLAFDARVRYVTLGKYPV